MSRLVFILAMIGALVSSCSGTSGLSRSNASKEDKLAASLVKTGRSMLGKKYRYGGETHKGFDCSGLTKYIFANHDIDLARRAADQYRQGVKVDRLDARPGDLVFFINRGVIDHVALVTKVDGTHLYILHSTSSKGVIEEDMRASKYWSRRYKAVRRVI